MKLFIPLQLTLSSTITCASRHGNSIVSVWKKGQSLCINNRCYDVYGASSPRVRRAHTAISQICSKQLPVGGSLRYSNRVPSLETRVTGFYQKRLSGSKNGPPENSDTKSKPKSKLLSKLPKPVRENIYTVPNLLTFSRLLAAPAVGYLLVQNHHAAALSLFAFAGITDLVDGYIARRYNLQTVVGTIIDPAADKLLMTISVVCLALNGSMPAWLAILILGRDVGLTISAIYYRWISLPPPKTMARYWDFSLPSAEVKPTTLSKANTALQLLLVGSSIALPVLPEGLAGAWGLHDGLVGLQYIVAFTTITSAIGYMRGSGVKILTK